MGDFFGAYSCSPGYPLQSTVGGLLVFTVALRSLGGLFQPRVFNKSSNLVLHQNFIDTLKPHLVFILEISYFIGYLFYVGLDTLFKAKIATVGN